MEEKVVSCKCKGCDYEGNSILFLIKAHEDSRAYFFACPKCGMNDIEKVITYECKGCGHEDLLDKFLIKAYENLHCHFYGCPSCGRGLDKVDYDLCVPKNNVSWWWREPGTYPSDLKEGEAVLDSNSSAYAWFRDKGESIAKIKKIGYPLEKSDRKPSIRKVEMTYKNGVISCGECKHKTVYKHFVYEECNFGHAWCNDNDHMKLQLYLCPNCSVRIFRLELKHIKKKFMSDWKDLQRKWVHVGGDLEASYDGEVYVDFKTIDKEERLMFASKSVLEKALKLFEDDDDEPTFDKKSDEMHKRSGEYKSSDPLVGFLYLLARDHLSVGVIDNVVDMSGRYTFSDDVREKEDLETLYANGWLAKWAEDTARGLRKEEGEIPQEIAEYWDKTQRETKAFAPIVQKENKFYRCYREGEIIEVGDKYVLVQWDYPSEIEGEVEKLDADKFPDGINCGMAVVATKNSMIYMDRELC